MMPVDETNNNTEDLHTSSEHTQQSSEVKDKSSEVTVTDEDKDEDDDEVDWPYLLNNMYMYYLYYPEMPSSIAAE